MFHDIYIFWEQDFILFRIISNCLVIGASVGFIAIFLLYLFEFLSSPILRFMGVLLSCFLFAYAVCKIVDLVIIWYLWDRIQIINLPEWLVNVKLSWSV